MEKVLQIVGLGFGAVDAYWGDDDPNLSTWGINNAYIYGKLDKLFVMHDAKQTIKSSYLVGRDKISFKDAFEKYPDMEAIALNDFLYVYNIEKQQYGTAPADKLETLEKDPNYKILTKTIKFPIGEATKLMGSADYSSTVAYMFALAILEKFDRIRLYGFEVWSRISHEYEFEAPCIERWQKLAKGHGINTDISFDVIPTIKQENNLYGYVVKE